MPGSLVSIDAWNRRTASRETVRIGSALNSVTLGADGFVWEPALRRAPRLSMQLADIDLTGAVQLGKAELAVNAKMLTRVSDWRDLDWVGSTVRIYSGDSPFLSSMGTELIGRIYGGVTDPESGIASLQLEADRAIVDVPLLTRNYAGTGGAEGDPELRGNFKPAAFGSPINVPPLLINASLFIYQVDAYGALTSFAGVYEDLASYGPAKANYATYDQLAAATLGGGEWATCNALGMFRLGVAPTGTVTCDPVCGYGLPGEMMQRWLTAHAGVPDSRIRSASFTALTAAVQGAVGAVPSVSFWTADEGNVLDLMQRVCASCNAVPLLLLDGTVAVSRVIGGGSTVTLQRQGGTPPVTGWMRQDPPVPWWRMRMTAARSFYVNSASEIDYEDDIRLRGGYQATETYRQGDVVIGPDGAQYLFINPTPTKGVAPPNSSYWDIYTNAPDATTIKYPSGYTLAEKEPAEKDATSGAPAGTPVGGVLAEQLVDSVARIAADEWLSTAEKPQVILAYRSLDSTWFSLDARYQALGSPGDITPSWQQAKLQMAALGEYLVSLSPAWDNVNYDTPIVPATYRDYWGKAYTAVAALNAAITGRKGDAGASTFTLVNIGNTDFPTPTTVRKVSGTNDWNGKARTQQSFIGAAAISARLGQGTFIGLTTDPDANLSYDTIDYGWYLSDNGRFYFYNNGTERWNSGDSPLYGGGSLGRMVSDGLNVYCYIGDTLKFTYPQVSKSETLFGAFALLPVNAQINDVTFTGNGVFGQDGKSPISISLQPATVTLNAYADGTLYSGQLPYSVGVTATIAGTATPVTGIAIIATQGMAVQLNPLRVTDVSTTDAYAVIDVTAAGQTVRAQISATIVREGSDGSTSTRISINAPQLTWTAFAQHGNSIGFNASATGKIRVNLTGTMTGDPNADYVLRFVSKLQYRVAGGSWIDVPGSQFTSTEGGTTTIGDGGPVRIVRANVNGQGPYVLTGLTADGAYEIRALTYKTSSAGSSSVALSIFAERIQ